MPGVIVVANQKGGVGKTTASAHLAQTLGLLYEGKVPILAIDTDPQGSLEDVISTSTSPFKPQVIAMNSKGCTYQNRSLSKKELDQILSSYQQGIIIIDEPAGITKHTLEDLALSDVAVLPVTPRKLDVDVFKTFYTTIEQTTQPYVLINMWDKRSKEQRKNVLELLRLASHDESAIIPQRVMLQQNTDNKEITDLFLPHAQRIHERLPKQKTINTQKLSDTLWAHTKGLTRRSYSARRIAQQVVSTAATISMLLLPTATAKIESKYNDVYAQHKTHTHIVQKGESWWHIGKYSYAMNMMEFSLESDEVKEYIVYLLNTNENIEQKDVQEYLEVGTRIIVPPPKEVFPPAWAYDARRDAYEKIRAAFFRDQPGLIYITSTFDELRWYKKGRRRVQLPHRAIDIAAPRGTKVYAHCANHRKKSAGTSPVLGKYYAYHCPNDPNTYLVAHLSQIINGSNVLGTVGNTGRSSGDHIHVAIFNGDTLSRRAKRLDPLLVIGGLHSDDLKTY